jgi:oxalate decarboxylase/phosphoglucose isomerase-like protein (cupin superfamily)
MKVTSVIIFAAAMGPAVMAQPFTFQQATYQPQLSEPQMRRQSNYTGFVYSLPNSKPTDLTPNSNIRQNQAPQNPFLTSLPNGGNGQTVVTMGPCAGNTPHTHPRGSEISFMLYGNITFGMIEENANMNNPIIRNITAGDTIHIPQGVLHFSHNPYCQPAAFLANFGNSDPGTQTTWNSMMRIPSYILNAATGLTEDTINQLKSLPLVTAPGTGGEDCLRRCGLSFTAANNLTTTALQLDGMAFQMDPMTGTRGSPAAAPASSTARAAAPAVAASNLAVAGMAGAPTTTFVTGESG